MATQQFYVYLHRRNDTNSVFYVGKGFGKRAWKKADRNQFWKRVESKHGRSVEIYKQNLTESEAFSLEKDLIRKFGRETLCNLNDGGEGGTRPAESSRLKMSQSRKGVKFTEEHKDKLRVAASKHKHTDETKLKLSIINKGKVGVKHTDETKRKLSESRKGVVFTKEHCQKISEGKRGKSSRKLTEQEKENLRKVNIGKVVSSETRQKISDANKGKRHSKEALLKITASNRAKNELTKKPILCSNGTSFSFSGDAVKWLRSIGFETASRSNIVNCCRGRLRTAYGFTWVYI